MLQYLDGPCNCIVKQLCNYRKKTLTTTIFAWKRKTYEGRHDPSILGESRPHRGLGQGQGGAACGRVPRWPVGLRVRRGDPSYPIHHQSPTSATLRYPLPRQGGRQGSAPTVPPTCNVWGHKNTREDRAVSLVYGLYWNKIRDAKPLL